MIRCTSANVLHMIRCTSARIESECDIRLSYFNRQALLSMSDTWVAQTKKEYRLTLKEQACCYQQIAEKFVVVLQAAASAATRLFPQDTGLVNKCTE